MAIPSYANNNATPLFCFQNQNSLLVVKKLEHFYNLKKKLRGKMGLFCCLGKRASPSLGNEATHLKFLLLQGINILRLRGQIF